MYLNVANEGATRASVQTKSEWASEQMTADDTVCVYINWNQYTLKKAHVLSIEA